MSERRSTVITLSSTRYFLSGSEPLDSNLKEAHASDGRSGPHGAGRVRAVRDRHSHLDCASQQLHVGSNHTQIWTCRFALAKDPSIADCTAIHRCMSLHIPTSIGSSALSFVTPYPLAERSPQQDSHDSLRTKPLHSNMDRTRIILL